MASKKSAKPNAWEVEFVNIYLSEHDKKALPAWDSDGAKAFDCFESLVSEGCKIAFSYDENNDSYICSCTVPKPEGAPKKRCVSSRGRSVLMSLKALAFKLEYKLDGDITALYSTSTAVEDFG